MPGKLMANADLTSDLVHGCLHLEAQRVQAQTPALSYRYLVGNLLAVRP